MSVTMTLAQAKAHLSDVVGRVGREHERVTVTVHGRPFAVLLSPDDLDSLEETLAVLADSDAMAQLAASERDIAAGRVETVADLDAVMRERNSR